MNNLNPWDFWESCPIKHWNTCINTRTHTHTQTDNSTTLSRVFGDCLCEAVCRVKLMVFRLSCIWRFPPPLASALSCKCKCSHSLHPPSSRHPLLIHPIPRPTPALPVTYPNQLLFTITLAHLISASCSFGRGCKHLSRYGFVEPQWNCKWFIVSKHNQTKTLDYSQQEDMCVCVCVYLSSTAFSLLQFGVGPDALYSNASL